MCQDDRLDSHAWLALQFLRGPLVGRSLLSIRILFGPYSARHTIINVHDTKCSSHRPSFWAGTLYFVGLTALGRAISGRLMLHCTVITTLTSLTWIILLSIVAYTRWDATETSMSTLVLANISGIQLTLALWILRVFHYCHSPHKPPHCRYIAHPVSYLVPIIL